MDIIIDFCKKNIKYISAGGVGVLMIIMLCFGAFSKGGDKQAAEGDNAVVDDGASLVQEKEDSAVYKLISDYYTAYAAGDVDTLATLADPISDFEKSYIAFLSDYLEAYEINEIYSQPGVSDDDLLVSVSENMKFKDIESVAPGMDFFYVVKSDDGSYKIDNRYSTFNMQSHELDMDPQVTAVIARFEQQDDLVELQDEIQSSYNETSISDKDFNTFMTSTIQEATSKWKDSYKEEQAKAEEEAKKKEEEEAKKAEEEAKAAEEEAKKAEEEAKAAEEDQQEEAEAEDEDDGKEYVYTTDKINIRKGTTVESRVLYTVKKGKKLEKLGKEGDWIKVKYKGKAGYVRSLYVTDKDPKAIEKGNTITIKETINIRRKKSTDSPKVAIVNKGDKVKILSVGKTWTKVKYKRHKGYIKTSLLK